jgi:tetratricopeptide (TPR) repeat protein
MRQVSRLIVVLGVTILAAPLATATAAGPPTSQDAREQQQQLERAQENIDQGEPEKALEMIEDLLEANGNLWVAHYLKGMAHGQIGDENDALASFLAADERQPRVPDVYCMAGIAAFGVGDYETCWEQTILAHQAGRDMSKEILQLSEVADPPDDLAERINTPRVLLGPMNTSVPEHNSAMKSVLIQVQGELTVVQRQVQRAYVTRPTSASYGRSRSPTMSSS